MSLAITIVTTANRRRRFFQTDPGLCGEILASLGREAQLFSGVPLVIATADATEIFSPREITRIEIETADDLAPYLPAGREIRFRALAPEEFALFGEADDRHIATPVEFFFSGGDTFSAWMEADRDATQAERAMRIAHLFTRAVIPYELPNGGIGFVNPSVLTRLRLAVGIDGLPAGTWHAHEA